MYLEVYNGTQREQVGAWLKERNSPYTTEDLPEIGFVAYERGEAIACAFLRNVEGPIAMFDGLCTNPEFPSDMRDSAIDMLVEKILDKAKSLGYKGILAYTVDRGTIVRSLKHGFEAMPHALIVADFSKKA